ncbi:MAG: extracellular solute-binding protein [bacterium]
MWDRLLLSFLLLFFLRGLQALAAEPLVIISPHWEGIREEFTRDFKAWYKQRTGRDVEITWMDQGGASNCLRFVKSEFARSPEGIGIDLFYGGGVSPYNDLASRRLLFPYRVPEKILEKMPPDINGLPLYDPYHRWYGTSLSGFGILYNKRILKMLDFPMVEDWEGLTDPAIANWVGSADPRDSSSIHTIYDIVLQAYGWKKGWAVIIKMGANINGFVRSSAQIGKDLAAGETAYGLCIDTYAYSAIADASEDNLGFVFPRQVTAITPDPIAILKGAPNMDRAKAFIRYSLSPRAQRIWMYRAGVPGGPEKFSLHKMSILPEVYETERLEEKTFVRVNPFAAKKGLVYDFEKSTARWGVLNDLMGAFVIDTHNDLVGAWKNAAGDEKVLAEIGKMPVTEEKAMDYAKKWDNPEFRNEKISEWLKAARKKYKNLQK